MFPEGSDVRLAQRGVGAYDARFFDEIGGRGRMQDFQAQSARKIGFAAPKGPL